jgi:hypothetical protein
MKVKTSRTSTIENIAKFKIRYTVNNKNKIKIKIKIKSIPNQ